VSLRARDAGQMNIIGQILVHPATCHPDYYPHDKHTLDSMEENKLGPVLSQVDMEFFWGK